MGAGRRRSLAKAVTWRIIGIITTTSVVFLMTGEMAMAATAGLVDAAVKFALYYFHERGWAQVKWGLDEETVVQ